jgi:hypothetical protein
MQVVDDFRHRTFIANDRVAGKHDGIAAHAFGARRLGAVYRL